MRDGRAARLEPLPERVFFSDVHYLALVADDETLRRRLRARPAWREWDEPRIAEMLEFNLWIRGQVESIDTTDARLDDVVTLVEKWVRARIGSDLATLHDSSARSRSS